MSGAPRTLARIGSHLPFRLPEPPRRPSLGTAAAVGTLVLLTALLAVGWGGVAAAVLASAATGGVWLSVGASVTMLAALPAGLAVLGPRLVAVVHRFAAR